MIDISGVMIPATTPFEAHGGAVDRVALRQNVQRWGETGVRGLVMGGSTGEAVLLDEDERHAVLEVAIENAAEHLLMVAGTGAESRRATIRRTRLAGDLGYDAVLVQPPAFYRGAMTPQVLRDHYVAVAECSDVPVILYQVPTRFSTLEFSTGLVAQLATHDNIVGIKDSRGKLDLVGELLSRTDGFQVLVGSGAILYGALEMGASGGILGVANVAPAECARIHDLFRAGDGAGAGRLQERIGPLHNALVGKMGVAGVKCGLDLCGYRGGAPRPPLSPLPPDRRPEVAALLRAAGIGIREASAAS